MSGTAANWSGYSPKITTTFPVAFSKTPVIASIAVLPGQNPYGGGVTNRTGRLSLKTSYSDSDDTYLGVIEASSTGMSIRYTSNSSSGAVTATVYYVVVGK